MVADVVRARAVAASLALGAATLTLAGCTGGQTAGTLASPSTDAFAGAPIDRPASRVDDLGQEDLPVPGDLGRGWDYRVDHGNAEDGYVGSGQPATAREPGSVLAAITPLGCRPGRLPRPESALEVTYVKGKVPGVGVVLRFDEAQTARRFFVAHAQVLSRCVGSDHVDLAVKSQSDSLLVTTRAEQLGETPEWTEGVGLQGDEVMLIAVADTTSTGVRSVISALT
jgi:hypothetical protein